MKTIGDIYQIFIRQIARIFASYFHVYLRNAVVIRNILTAIVIEHCQNQAIFKNILIVNCLFDASVFRKIK